MTYEQRQPENVQEAIKADVDGASDAGGDDWIKAAAAELSKHRESEPKPEPTRDDKGKFKGKEPPAEEPKAEPEQEPAAEPEKPKEEPKDEAKDLRRQNVELREKLLKRERKLAEREAAADAKVREALQQSEQARKLVDRIRAKDLRALEEMGVSLSDLQMQALANPPSPEVSELKRMVDEMRAERQKEREESERRVRMAEQERHAEQQLTQYMGAVEKALQALPMASRLAAKVGEIGHPAHPMKRAWDHATRYAADHGGVALDPVEVARYVEGKLIEESKWFADEPSAARPPVSSPKAEPRSGRTPTNSDAGQAATLSHDDDDETYYRKAAELLKRSAAGNSP